MSNLKNDEKLDEKVNENMKRTIYKVPDKRIIVRTKILVLDVIAVKIHS